MTAATEPDRKIAATIIVTIEMDEDAFDQWAADRIDRAINEPGTLDVWGIFLNEMQTRLLQLRSPMHDGPPPISVYGAQLSSVVRFDPDTEPF